MAQYLVTARRARTGGDARTAAQCVSGAPGVALLQVHSAEMVTIEADEQQAQALQTRLAGLFYVEPVVQRGLLSGPNPGLK